MAFLPAFYHLGAALIPAATIIGYRLRPAKHKHPLYYSDWNASEDGTAKLIGDEHAKAQLIFMERIKAYRERCAALNTNAYSWILLIGLTLLVLVKGWKEGFPLFSIAVPRGAIHAAVIACMLYLWLQFGSTLKFLIYERMALWRLVDRIEGALAVERVVALSSLRPLLHGFAFLDIWFATFLPSFALTSAQTGGHKQINSSLDNVIWVGAAALIGLAHASALVLLWDVRALWGSMAIVNYAVPIVQAAVVALVVVCYLYFQVERHGGWFFVACSLMACLWMETLPYLTCVR